jgi:hypothetical protein
MCDWGQAAACVGEECCAASSTAVDSGPQRIGERGRGEKIYMTNMGLMCDWVVYIRLTWG